MTAALGSALWLQWTWSGGTLQVDTDYRNWQYTPGAEFFDETAGAASSKEYIPSMKSGQAQAGGVMQAGSAHVYGSALAEQNLGTLRWCPEGTANGKYHGTAAFYSQGMAQNQVYNQIIEWTCSFMQTGVRTEGTIN